MIEIKGVAHFSIAVSDLERSRRFIPRSSG